MIDDDPIGLNGHAGLHGDQATAVALESFVSHEKGDVLRRARMSVSADCEPTDDHVADTQPRQLGRGRPHRVEHPLRDHVVEERQVGRVTGIEDLLAAE